MDHAAWLQQGLEGEDDAREAYRFFMRVDPSMRDKVGPIEEVEDERTGRRMRRRRYKVGMVRNPRPESLRDVWVYLDPLPHIRLDHAKDLQGWYQPKHNDKRGSRVRPCMTDAILTEPYGGYCTVGCAFCYINSGHRGYRGSGLVTVPLDYGAHVRRQLRSMQVSAAGYFSSFTDPFLPLEDFYGNTRAGVQAFLDEGLPVFFLSRLSYPPWAFDALRKNAHSYAQKSINTPSQDDWEKLSPGAVSLEQHFAEVRDLCAQGTYVSIQCNPIIAGITTHEEVEELFGLLAAAGANHVIVKFVEANAPWAPAMVERITRRFGANRAAAFRDLFTENSAGAQKTVEARYRLEGHERYRATATRLGMTYATCYEYVKTDRGHASIGPVYTTADQCHGHRVPMYVRGEEGRMAPLAACPPSGCLSCADQTGGAACGSDLLGQARALRISDLRRDPFAKAPAPEPPGGRAAE